MHEDQIEDLKQFFAAKVSQTEKNLEVKIADLRSEVAGLRNEMADGFAGVGEAIESVHDRATERDIEVDKRLAKLKQRTA